MLEIKNLTKIYKQKKADDVIALNNVSVSFGETGMVFLLGKSGSGKSTLLNVIGGLDSFDRGDIIIKGKSSKAFKQKDFDSYRNTYVGFVFQEYNVLSEFTVQKNIALALELQGKKADKASVENLLAQVDLSNYAKRKPNQLSGGQKQRIAIARALIKEPEIIMADEPTGALDSATGKQVLDTLKKLSQTKLVIVVSHDREFAEQYGDRIIELKDGKIISDVTKRKAPPEVVTEGFNVLGNNMIHISKNHKLSKDEVEIINKMVESSDSEVIISANEGVNPDIKKLAKIDDNGNSEFFSKTNAEDVVTKKYKGSDLKLIKSRLKFKDSFKMGASGLKTKKAKLFFTILLTAVALTFFGIADTMGCFDARKANYNSLVAANINTMQVYKEQTIGTGFSSYSDRGMITDEDYQTLKTDNPDMTFLPALSGNDYYIQFYKTYNNDLYYISNIDSIVPYTSSTDVEKFGYELACGEYPSHKNEFAITKYQYDIIEHFGYSSKDGKSYEYNASATAADKNEFKNMQDFLTKIKANHDDETRFSSGGGTYKLVGIIDTHVDLSAYSSLKDLKMNEVTSDDYNLSYQLRDELRAACHNSVFINSENFDTLIENKQQGVYIQNEYTTAIGTATNTLYSAYNNGDKIVNKHSVVFFDGRSNNELKADEIIVDSGAYLSEDLSFYCSQSSYYDYDTETFKYYVYLPYADSSSTNFYVFDAERGAQDRAALIAKVKEIYNTNIGEPLTLKFKDYNEDKVYEYKIAGVYFDFLSDDFEVDDYFYISNDNNYHFKNTSSVPEYAQNDFGEYEYVFVSLSDNAEANKKFILGHSAYGEPGVNLVISSSVSDVISSYKSMFAMMSKIFLYMAIGFAVFSAILLMNFIATSISYKKKEIGILRALGAKGSDVYGIFFNESLIITFINFVISVILTFVGVYVVNYFLAKEVGYNLVIFSAGIRQVLLIFAISLIVAIVASFIPTQKISRMKPIDAIQERK